MNTMSNACLICHDKDKGQTELRQIEEMLKIVKDIPVKHTGKHLQWGTHFRCKYGIYCNEMKRTENLCRMKEEEFERKFDVNCLSDEQIHKLLTLSRGYFPSVYHLIDTEWRIYKAHN